MDYVRRAKSLGAKEQWVYFVGTLGEFAAQSRHSGARELRNLAENGELILVQRKIGMRRDGWCLIEYIAIGVEQKLRAFV